MRQPFLATLLLLLLDPTSARAAESYDNCTGFVDTLPAIISTQGTWCLRKDQSTAIDTGAAITIATNNVTLDCNHFKLGGLAAGPGTQAVGVEAQSRLNMTVRNCNIRGFMRGVLADIGGGHVIEDNRFEGNTLAGIVVLSDNSLIRRNQILDTSGSTAFPGETYGIFANGSHLQVTDNVISGLVATSSNGYIYALRYATPPGGGGSILRNTISGLDPITTGGHYGIYSSGPLMIVGNNVQGWAENPLGVGILCISNKGTARDNNLDRWNTPIVQCVSSGNLVNPN